MLSLLSEKCPICNNKARTVLYLPNLPLTGIYSLAGQDKDYRGFDQELLFCEHCSHGQLKYVVPPDHLYGQNYSFRTSDSRTASDGAHFFLQYLTKLFPDKTFEKIVEFGCNDAYLLKLLKKGGEQLLGIDFIWKDRESEFDDDQISVIGNNIEEIDLRKTMGGAPDLIISQHTMEHLENPKALLQKLVSEADNKTIFLFEFPCFNILLEQMRFDQIFHQHLQYYSVQSTIYLLESVGCELIDLAFNTTYWGALLIAFRKADGSIKKRKWDLRLFANNDRDTIISRYDLFKKQMETTKFAIDRLDRNHLYGYGAALMLPILGYHLKSDFSEFKAIFDDDIRKDGMSYINLPVAIRYPGEFDFSESSICLTAMDNRRPILSKLIAKKPKYIINPLLFL